MRPIMSVDAALGPRPYVTALKSRQLTPLYDPVIRWLFREHTMKSRLVDQVAPRPHENVLDIGCGTGTLAILLKRAGPAANVVGVDGDPAVVEIARRKTATIGLEIRFDGGMAYDLPYEDASFDAGVASLVLHHLAKRDKEDALREVCRVLRPRGSFHALDFGVPQNGLMRSLARVSGLLEDTEDGVEGRLPRMFVAAGLDDVQETSRYMTPLGTIALYRARKLRGVHAGRSRSRMLRGETPIPGGSCRFTSRQRSMPSSIRTRLKASKPRAWTVERSAQRLRSSISSKNEIAACVITSWLVGKTSARLRLSPVGSCATRTRWLGLA